MEDLGTLISGRALHLECLRHSVSDSFGSPQTRSTRLLYGAGAYHRVVLFASGQSPIPIRIERLATIGKLNECR
jgi:hypothetical protein